MSSRPVHVYEDRTASTGMRSRRSALLLLLNLSCAIDVRQVPAPRTVESLLAIREETLYLGNVDVYSAERDHLGDAWRATLASVIRSHRVSFLEITALVWNAFHF
jgi:hypothetical protein